jgi:hypothetical protein
MMPFKVHREERCLSLEPPVETVLASRFAGRTSLSFAKNPSGGQAIDRIALLRAESRSDDHHAASPGSTLTVSLRRPPLPRRREPGLAPANLPCTSGQRPGRSSAGVIDCSSHVRDLVSIDPFTVPTARLRALFVLVVLAHHRRRVLHFAVGAISLAIGGGGITRDLFRRAIDWGFPIHSASCWAPAACCTRMAWMRGSPRACCP